MNEKAYRCGRGPFRAPVPLRVFQQLKIRIWKLCNDRESRCPLTTYWQFHENMKMAISRNSRKDVREFMGTSHLDRDICDRAGRKVPTGKCQVCLDWNGIVKLGRQVSTSVYTGSVGQAHLPEDYIWGVKITENVLFFLDGIRQLVHVRFETGNDRKWDCFSVDEAPKLADLIPRHCVWWELGRLRMVSQCLIFSLNQSNSIKERIDN